MVLLMERTERNEFKSRDTAKFDGCRALFSSFTLLTVFDSLDFWLGVAKDGALSGGRSPFGLKGSMYVLALILARL